MFFYKGNSMKGVFSYGSMLQIKPVNIKELQIGDIIVFKDIEKKFGFKYITHRIIIKNDNSLITKGDNNKYQDCLPVNQNELIGKVVSFEKDGRTHKVIGGLCGLYLAKIRSLARRLVFYVYKKASNIFFVRLILKFILNSKSVDIKKVQFKTGKDKIFKWILNGRVIARKESEKNYFFVKKPYDLIIKK